MHDKHEFKEEYLYVGPGAQHGIGDDGKFISKYSKPSCTLSHK